MLPCSGPCWDQQNDHQPLLTRPSAGAPTHLRFSVKCKHLCADMTLTGKSNGDAAMRKIRERLRRTIQPIIAEGRPGRRAEGAATGAASKQEIPAGRSRLLLASFYVPALFTGLKKNN